MRLKPLLLTILVSTNVYSNEAKTFQQQIKICYDRISDEWPTKTIEIAEDRIENNLYQKMTMRCFKPACENAFTWVLFEVRYINGGIANVNCSVKDGDEPQLDRYNEDNKFTPPQ